MSDELTAMLLDTLQRDRDAAVRQEAVLALGCVAECRPHLIPLLEEALDDSSHSVRRGVVHALGLSRRSEAIGPLLRALQVRAELWAAAADAIVTIGDTSVRSDLVALVQTSDQPRVRRGALRALGRLSSDPTYRSESLNSYEDADGVVHVLA